MSGCCDDKGMIGAEARYSALDADWVDVFVEDGTWVWVKFVFDLFDSLLRIDELLFASLLALFANCVEGDGADVLLLTLLSVIFVLFWVFCVNLAE